MKRSHIIAIVIIVFAITRVFRWLERHYLRHLERRREPAAATVAPPMGIK